MRDTVSGWILSRRAISGGVLRPDDTASTISFFCSAVRLSPRNASLGARFMQAGARPLADHLALEFGTCDTICPVVPPVRPAHKEATQPHLAAEVGEIVGEHRSA
jgi:hypothetical protein